ncbi:nucleolar protein 7 [Oxyura jamaicensis]|uniref:nucleolar protein 7 n=1 Tax=Oxyura jamaicensis TaxID=8884 RepID=UPI0015A5BC01|nr:nucleolar protein 7 [Oxyura jamaicensis]
MVRRRQREAEAVPAGPPASPDSDDDEEAPEELSFGAAAAAAESERQLAGEAARRHRELLKERRRRRQELFVEQKRRKLLPDALLQELAAGRPDKPAAAAERDKQPGRRSEKQSKGRVRKQVKQDKARGARSEGNYTAMHLKDQSLTGLHQQTAKDFVYSHLYGPGTNRTSANEFFSLANKKDPVKKAAVQFVDKSWGLEKKQKATKFKKHWIAVKMQSTA